MKYLRIYLFFLSVTILFLSCQKELTIEAADAIGTLKSEASGDCLPVLINGTYQKDTLLMANNYMDIEVDISQTGNYTITTDTLNGYYFNATGVIAQAGVSTIRLRGHGRPMAQGVDVFTVLFSGTSCQVNIIVTAPPVGPPAVYSFGGSPGSCSGAVMSGTYQQGLATTASNTATLTVNVTIPGSYNITTGAANGVTFSATGAFTSAGPATVVLTATGTPTAAITSAYTVNSGTGSCSFSVIYAVASGPATYTINCTTPVLAGTYMQGVATGAANTATLSVNVTAPGTYSLNTGAVNGVTFSGSGNFAATGPATVVLTAIGTPTAAVTSAYPVNSGSGSCNFNVTYVAAPSTPAAFTLDCASVVINGNYVIGVPLNATNTITISVNVTTPGTYTIGGSGVNGMVFVATGVFLTAPTIQTVTLIGTGTPTSAGNAPLPIIGLPVPCTPLIPVHPGSLLYATVVPFLQGFDAGAAATYDNTSFPGFNVLNISGAYFTGGLPTIQLSVKTNIPGPIPVGTYTVNASGYTVFGQYTSGVGIFSDLTDGTTHASPALTIIITSSTATHVKGTFSGTLRQNGVGPSTIVLSGGFIDVPVL